MKAKNKLHATRVDRIAIVDRPAVPDAEMVVFKRFKDKDAVNLCKILKIDKGIMNVNFRQSFVMKATGAAVDALQEQVIDAIYADNTEDSLKVIKTAFKDFSVIVKDFLAKLGIEKVSDDADEMQLTTEDIAKPFARGLSWSAMSEGFAYFKSSISYLVLGMANLSEPEKTLSKVIGTFEKFVTDNLTEIVENKREIKEVLEKEGRVISTQRLRKLKEAITVLSEMVNEAESRVAKKSESELKEEESMELKDILKKLEEVSADVKGFGDRITAIETAVREKGMLLTEAEIQDAEKKVKAQKVEADRKAKDEADAAEKKAKDEKVIAEKKKQDELVEKRKKLGLPEDASEEVVEKKENEILEANKKFQAELPQKIEKIEKALSAISTVLEKRLGVKTSLETDDVTDKGTKEDPFGKVLRG